MLGSFFINIQAGPSSDTVDSLRSYFDGPSMSNQTVGACDYLYGGDKPPPFMPNPDVSGIGVLIGFLVTAYLTFCFVVVYYLTGCIEDAYTNDIDKMVLAKLSLRKYPTSMRRLEMTLRRAILIFSDQQVVTGIALLSSGYAQLTSGIGIYHWQILVYLAWFSSLTHLATLTVLRQHFRDNLAARLWRSVLMLVTVIMLGVALLPTGDAAWLTGVLFAGDDAASQRGVPALCFFKRLVSRKPHQRYSAALLSTFPMGISLFVLISGYLMRLLKLSDNATAFSRHWIRTKPSHEIGSWRDSALKRVARPSPKFLNSHWVSAYVLLEALLILLRALFDIYESILWEILWLAFALAWGTRNLFITRAYSSDNTENTWGFGQLFPVLLLLLPLVSFVETYHEKDSSSPIENGSAAAQVKNDNGPRLLRVGQWGPGAASKDHMSLVPLDEPLIIRRTRTDIQTEEEQLDTIVSRMSQHFDSPSEIHNTPRPTSGNVSSSKNIGPDQDTGCYEFEWVWILILTLIASISTFIIYILAEFGQSTSGFMIIIMIVLYMLNCCFWYTAAFVALSYFHKPLGKVIEKYLGIGSQRQHALLRTLAWLYLPFVVSMVIVILLLGFGQLGGY